MIQEIATITVVNGSEAQFEAAVASSIELFRRAQGCRDFRLERCVEDPATYLLIVGWETVASHDIDFRQSEDFQEWRRRVSPFFAKSPTVAHSAVVFRGF